MSRSLLARLEGCLREYSRQRELHGKGTDGSGHVLLKNGEKFNFVEA